MPWAELQTDAKDGVHSAAYLDDLGLHRSGTPLKVLLIGRGVILIAPRRRCLCLLHNYTE